MPSGRNWTNQGLAGRSRDKTNWPRDLRRVAVRMNVALESGGVADLGHAALQVPGETETTRRRLCTVIAIHNKTSQSA